MPYLTDHSLKQSYVNHLFKIHKHFAEFSINHRKTFFEGALRAIANAAGLPVPRIGWGDDGGYFRYWDWYLQLDNRAVTMNPHQGSVRAWLYFSTMPYHELRHCEQFFLMAQAMLTGGVSIPAGARGRGVLPHGSITSRAEALQQMCYPMIIVVRADQVKSTFPQSMIPLTRAWADSVFGRGNRARSQTLTHLSKGAAHMQPYIHLPEEADAWAVEREVSRMVRARINQAATDDALEGVSALLGG